MKNLLAAIGIFAFGLTGSYGASAQDAAMDQAPNSEAPAIEEVWTVETGATMYGRPGVDAEHVYAGGRGGILRAFNRETGAEVWSYDAGSFIGSSIAVDLEYLYFATWDGSVHAVWKADGTRAWRFQTEGEKHWDLWDHVQSTPIFDHERVYFGSGDHHLYGLNKRNGALRWKVKTGGIIHGDAAIDGEKVIVGSFDGKLYAVDRANGTVLWAFKTVGNDYFRNGAISSSPAIHDGVAYVGSRDYNLYAVLTETGTGAWNYRSPSWIVARPLVLDERVYFSTSDAPHLFVLNQNSGLEVSRTKLNLNTYGAAVPVGEGYVATMGEDGRINLIARDGSGIAATYDSPAARANRDQYYDGNERRPVNYTSMRDYTRKYLALLKDLGAVVSGLSADGDMLFYSDAAGVVGAVRVTGISVAED